MTTTHNFLGIPIEGDIIQGGSRRPQRSLEELAPLMQALINDETIAEFGWIQRTPYYSDGDPCVFSAFGLWIRTVEDEEDADRDDLELSYSGHPTLGEKSGTYRNGTWTQLPYQGTDEARYDRCKALSEAIDGGEFDNVLLEAFGDHAEITVRREGITVEFYSHD